MNGCEAVKITFPWGIPGLEYREYALTSLEEDSPFYFLQALDEPDVGLILINPFTAYYDYEFDLGDDVSSQLRVSDGKKIAVLCTVNTSRGIKQATVNLLAPVVINTEKMLAKQVVLSDQRYSVRAPLPVKTRAAGKE